MVNRVNRVPCKSERYSPGVIRQGLHLLAAGAIHYRYDAGLVTDWVIVTVE